MMTATALANERGRLNELMAEHRLAQMNVRREKAALSAAKQLTENTETAQRLVQEIAEKIQNEAVGRIAATVTHCLRSVFGEDAYEFRIDFAKSRGKTEARFRLVRGGLVLDEPLEQTGGGVIDVVSFALRVSCLMLSVPRRRRLLILDEPFKHLHGEANRERAAALIETLAEELNIQFVIATGLEWLKIGRVVEVGGR